MTPSQACAALVARFEGCRLQAYPDPKTNGDPWTIGFGHTGPEVCRGVSWTQEQAQRALAADIAAFGERVLAVCSRAPTQHQLDALTSFAFNVGMGRRPGGKGKQGLWDSTLLRKHNAGDFDGAAAQFLLWINKGSNVEAGLRRRRDAEARMYKGLLS